MTFTGPDLNNKPTEDTTLDTSDYTNMVKVLAKPGGDILDEMTHTQAHLTHMAIGVAGEAGELLDAIKRHTIYQKKIDLENVIEELGDIEFYLEGIRMTLGIPRNLTLKKNMQKLEKRYKNHYSNEAAQARADKN